MPDPPALTGKQLIRLLVADGWEIVRNAPHGAWLRKRFPHETRFATVKDTRAQVPPTYLAIVLSAKVTGIGRQGLLALIEKHGLR